MVLCQRGVINFSAKVNNVGAGGGLAAVIYNNVEGSLAASMAGVATTTPAVGISKADGETLMATPHVSAVAALVWSYNPTWTNAQVRIALEQSAKTAKLTWTGSSALAVDVFRNGVKIASPSNTGTYSDALGRVAVATYTYRVCESATSVCSPRPVQARRSATTPCSFAAIVLLMIRSVCLVAMAGSLIGCAALQPRLVDASVQKPSNVAVYFTVDTRAGEPVPGLSADQFRILEDDKLVSKFESKQTILNPEVAAMHYLLLLVDMSASVTESGSGAALEEAVASFTDRVGQYQQTAIFGFDGRPELIPIRGFAPGKAGASGLSTLKPRDPSTNLNGAIIEAAKVLEKQLERSPVPLRFGTLVIFTDGTDQAHRAAAADVRAALDQASFEVFVIGVGAEIDEPELRAIGRSGAALSRDPGTLGASFDQVAARIEGFSKRYYLLSYCSPARAGMHDLRIEPVTTDGQTGSLTYRFNAQGFGPDCDPNRKPTFDMRHPKQKLAR